MSGQSGSARNEYRSVKMIITVWIIVALIGVSAQDIFATESGRKKSDIRCFGFWMAMSRYSLDLIDRDTSDDTAHAIVIQKYPNIDANVVFS